MKFIFIYGPPAAGKHTIAKPLAEQTGIALFHNHLVVDLVGSLFAFGTNPFARLREKLWLESFRAAIDQDLSLIFTFNPESSVRPGLINDIFALFREANASIHVIELICSDKTIESRLGNESRSRFGKLTNVDIYRDAMSNGGFTFDYHFEPGLTINTDQHSPESAVSEIRSWLGRQS